MIIDKIDNLKNYPAFSGRIAKGLEIIRDTDFSKIEDGKYVVEEDNLFYCVSRYKTRPLDQGKFEVHEKFLDIQFIADGEELFGYTPLESLKLLTPYDEDNDIAFYEKPQTFSKIDFSKGMFAIVWPEDAHMPCINMENETDVLKIVVKVRIDG